MTTATRTGHRGPHCRGAPRRRRGDSPGEWCQRSPMACGRPGGVLRAVRGRRAYLWSGGKGDVAAIMRVGGDERQKGIDRDATVITGMALSLAALVGAIVETARDGNPGAFGIMCLVGGLSYVVP